MELNAFFHGFFDFLARCSGCDATREVRQGGSEAGRGFLDCHQIEFH
jgi:hypothetical protein